MPLATNAADLALERRSLPKGVYRTSWGTAYFVQFRYHGELYYCGTWPTIEEAVSIRDQARRQLESIQ